MKALSDAKVTTSARPLPPALSRSPAILALPSSHRSPRLRVINGCTRLSARDRAMGARLDEIKEPAASQLSAAYGRCAGRGCYRE